MYLSYTASSTQHCIFKKFLTSMHQIDKTSTLFNRSCTCKIIYKCITNLIFSIFCNFFLKFLTKNVPSKWIICNIFKTFFIIITFYQNFFFSIMINNIISQFFRIIIDKFCKLHWNLKPYIIWWQYEFSM